MPKETRSLGRLVPGGKHASLVQEASLEGGPRTVAGPRRLVQNDDPEGRMPGPELPQPLPHDSGRAHYEGGPEHLGAMQPRQECCNLARTRHHIVQTPGHLIRGDTAAPWPHVQTKSNGIAATIHV